MTGAGHRSPQHKRLCEPTIVVAATAVKGPPAWPPPGPPCPPTTTVQVSAVSVARPSGQGAGLGALARSRRAAAAGLESRDGTPAHGVKYAIDCNHLAIVGQSFTMGRTASRERSAASAWPTSSSP